MEFATDCEDRTRRFKGLTSPTLPMLAALLTLIAFPAFCSAQGAQTPPSDANKPAAQVLTLESAIAEALRSNPGLQAASRQVEAARKQVNVARGQLYGELDAVLTAQHLNDAQLLRPMAGPFTPALASTMPFAQDQLHVGFTYTYPLYVGGRITDQIRIAELGVDNARERLTGTRWDTIYNVTALYLQAQALAAQANAVQQEIEALDTTRRNLELAVRIGKRPEVDLLKTLDRIEEAQAAKSGVLAQQQKLLALLMAVLGRNPAEAPALEGLPERLPELSTQPPALRDVALRRSSVRAAELAVALDDKQVAVARAALAPAVSFQATFLHHDELTSFDPGRPTWFVGLQVGLPVFDGGSRKAAVSRSQQEAEADRQRAEAARLQAVADLQAALAAWQSAQDQLRAAEAQYASAHEVARIEQLRFDTGAGDIEDLLRARSREVAAESARIAARAQIAISAAQINHVTESEVAR